MWECIKNVHLFAAIRFTPFPVRHTTPKYLSRRRLSAIRTKHATMGRKQTTYTGRTIHEFNSHSYMPARLCTKTNRPQLDPPPPPTPRPRCCRAKLFVENFSRHLAAISRVFRCRRTEDPLLLCYVAFKIRPFLRRRPFQS